MFLSTRRAWCDDCSACSGFCEDPRGWSWVSTLFSPVFLSSRLARPIHPDQNTTADLHIVSETSSFQAAPTPDSLEASPTRRGLLCPTIASPISVRLEPTFVICTTSGLSLTSHSLHRHGHHRAQETRNQQTVEQLSLSRSAALDLPSHVSKSHPVSRAVCSVRPPSS